MDFLELSKKRYSVREYESKKVEDDKLSRILEAAKVAPTACNNQPQRLIVVKTEEGLEKLKKGANVYGAPLAVIVCVDRSESWKRPFDKKDIGDIDAGIVATHMVLEAEELGLGTIWIGYLDPKAVKIEFNIPENVDPVSIIGIGYAKGQPASPNRHSTERKPLEKWVNYETF